METPYGCPFDGKRLHLYTLAVVIDVSVGMSPHGPVTKAPVSRVEQKAIASICCILSFLVVSRRLRPNDRPVGDGRSFADEQGVRTPAGGDAEVGSRGNYQPYR